jgi:hypothetical protein
MKLVMTPDPEPRNTSFHKKALHIAEVEKPGHGYMVTLECNHVVRVIGRLDRLNGVYFCQRCRDIDYEALGL